MDSFMEKLTHRFNSSEVIKANSEADAKSLEAAKEMNGKYEEIISEVRRLNLKCVETNEATNQLVQAGIEKFEAVNAAGNAQLSAEAVKEAVAAAIIESNITISDDRLKEIVAQVLSESVTKDDSAVIDTVKGQEEFLHKECVRVYRNVQSSLVEELKLQTEALAAQNSRLERKMKGIKPIAIISLIFNGIAMAGVVAGLVLWICDLI